MITCINVIKNLICVSTISCLVKSVAMLKFVLLTPESTFRLQVINSFKNLGTQRRNRWSIQGTRAHHGRQVK